MAWSFLHAPKARLAAGVVIAAAIGAAFSELPAPGLADTAASPTQPSAPGAPSGPTGPGGATGPRPCVAKHFRLRCPDLVMSAPSDLHMDRSTIPGHVLLRATSSINNRGSGP